MAITYSWVIRQLNTATVYGIPDVVSHVQYDYVGTDENGKTAYCQGTEPFQLVPYTYYSPATGKEVTVPAIFNKDSYIPYDQLTNEIIIGWLDATVPASAIQTFRTIIADKIANL